MIQALSVRCRLKVHPEARQEIDETLEKFAIACNQILEVAKRVEINTPTAKGLTPKVIGANLEVVYR
jgi:hypothetical protein